VTTSATLVAADGIVFVNLTAPATITLPATPADGQTHAIKDIGANFASNNCTINGGGHNIVTSSSVASAVMNINGQSWTMRYSSTAGLWGVF
jgi:hypothetical protein